MVLRITAKDVAERAGVSVTSVSLYVNGKAEGRLRPEMQQRIGEAVTALGYVPIAGAQDLARGTNGTVGIIVPDIANPFFGYLLAGLAAALPEDRELSLTVPHGGREYGMSDVRRALRGDPGTLLLTAPSSSLIESLEPDSRTILLDAPGVSSEWKSISWDIHGGCADLVSHLASLGHRKVAYLGLEHGATTMTLAARRSALEMELNKHAGGIVVDLLIKETSAMSARSILVDRQEELRRRGVTALIIEDDLYALGAFDALRQMGLRVPEEMSVAAFNDTQLSIFASPQISSVALDAAQMGGAAGDLAVKTTPEVPAGSQILPAKFFIRDSTGIAR